MSLERVKNTLAQYFANAESNEKEVNGNADSYEGLGLMYMMGMNTAMKSGYSNVYADGMLMHR